MNERTRDSGKLSRREFIKNSSWVLGGLAAGVGGSGLLASCNEAGCRVSISPASSRIVQSPPFKSACIGCGTCELVCATFHHGAAGPNLRRLWLERDGTTLSHHVLTCLQCDFPACYFACPLPCEALCIDGETGTRYIVTEKCKPGCDACIKACPFDPIRINYDPQTQTALMCDLCRKRPEGPACVEFCPTECLDLKA